MTQSPPRTVSQSMGTAHKLGLLLTGVGVILFVLSLQQPWWGMAMFAPQYPQGLVTITSLHGVTGGVSEIDELNHYIGMMRLNDAAKLERILAPVIIWAAAMLALFSALVRPRWLAWLLRIPLVTFPLVFMADVKYWLWYAGNHLDPKAALSSSIKAFTPVLLGEGKVAQFRTLAWLEPGFWLAAAGAVAVVAAGILLSRVREV